MEWINYHHLLYFWSVAKEGSIVKASEKLRLAQPTISGQSQAIRGGFLGKSYSKKGGRNLVLTEVGRLVFRYADEIFTLGTEMQDVLQGRPTNRPPKMVIGISSSFPRLIAHMLLAPTIEQLGPINLICREDKPELLLAELAIHNLDLVLSDAPMDPSIRVKAYNHLLGECGLTIYGSSEMVKAVQTKFSAGHSTALHFFYRRRTP